MMARVQLERFEATRTADLGIYFWRHFTVEPRAVDRWVVQAHFAAPRVPYLLTANGLEAIFARPPASTEHLAIVGSLDEAAAFLADHVG